MTRYFYLCFLSSPSSPLLTTFPSSFFFPFFPFFFSLLFSFFSELVLLEMAASNRSIMVGGKKKMITIDVHGEEDEEEQRSGNVSRVKTIELRGPRAREMYRKERVKYVVAPRHHRAMHTLYMHNPSFGPSVRLCRRWLHSMMLSDAYEHEVSSFFLCCWMLCGDALWMLCGMLCGMPRP